MFKAVNQFLTASGKPALFSIHTVTLTKDIKPDNSLFRVHTDKLLYEEKKTDLIIIPALSGDMKTE